MQYQNRLAGKIAEKEEIEERQKKLRRKYKVKEDGFIQVEKKRLTEILLKSAGSFLRLSVSILLILLATIGGICLIYPDTRSALFYVGTDLMKQMMGLLGI